MNIFIYRRYSAQGYCVHNALTFRRVVGAVRLIDRNEFPPTRVYILPIQSLWLMYIIYV